MNSTEPPVVIIGAGPVGLAAAAHLVEQGQRVVVLERGDTVGAAVAEWGHVSLFSSWSEVVDAAAARILSDAGQPAPTTGTPTGAAWVSHYLVPLADALDRTGPEPVIRCGHEVVGVTRAGRDRLVSSGRDEQPFSVHVLNPDGDEQRITARAVIDATGTWATPNPAGADGLPALGERHARTLTALISHRIPSPATLPSHRGGHTVVVGSGTSAFTALALLADLRATDPSTRITWVVRRPVTDTTYGGGANDELAARGALGQRARALVASGAVTLLEGFRVHELSTTSAGTTLIADDGRRTEPADRVVVLTGFRPDLQFLSELRLDLDPVLEAPRLLAEEVDPNQHSCGSVAATGARELAHPESNFFIIGAKSYGRAPTFLAMTGHEQARSVTAWLAGDHDAAARNELVLPDTGVCGGSGLYDTPTPTETSSGCC